MGDFLFTSESVTEGHPDKVCDQVSDAILDAILAKDPAARVACETLTKTGYVMIAGEVTLLADDLMRLHVSTDGLVLDGISMFMFFIEWHRDYVAGPGPGGDEAVTVVTLTAV